MSCLVAGAGYTGGRLLRALPGDAVGLRRSAAGDSLAIDLDRDVPTLPAADTIVYTVPPATGDYREDNRDDDREDDGDKGHGSDSDDARLARFLAGIVRVPRRFVYFSTSGVYGDTGGAPVDETAVPAPATPRARRRVAAERQLGEWSARHGVDLCILRVPGIYGPGRLGLARLRAGAPILRDADAGPGNRIHVDDLVAAALAAADPGRPAGIYNVGDGDSRSSSWFARTVAALAGLPAPPEITMTEARSLFSAKRLSFLEASRRLDLTRMRAELGVTPRYADAADGIRASLAE